MNASNSASAIGTRWFSAGIFCRKGAALDVGSELAEGRDALALQAVELGAEVAVDFGVARLCPRE